MAPNATPGSRKRGRPRKDEVDRNPSSKRVRRESPAATEHTTPSSLKSLKPNALGFTNRAAAHSGRGTTKKSPAPTKQSGLDIDGIYDFQGSDGEQSPVKTPSRRTRGGERSTNTKSPTDPKSGLKSIEKKAIRRKADPSAPQGSASGARGAPQTTSRLRYGHEDEVAGSTVSETERGEIESSGTEDVHTPVATESDKGLSLALINSVVPKVKGILTPSRRLSQRTAKTVAFDEHATDNPTNEIYFADLPNKPAKSKPPSQTRPSGKENKPLGNADKPEVEDGEEEEEEEEDEEEGDEDDEVCIICSKPDSEPPNEILFCDSCDMAVHQMCYGVVKIPDGDWLCKDCSQDASIGVIASDKEAISIMAVENVPDITNLEQHLRSLQRVLLDRCTGRRRIKLLGQDDAYDKTFQLVEQTILAGEGNSMLVIGARGCGKTTMVDSVLSDLSLEHKNEFHVIRLNGFIHTDDKLALKDIWRQLGKEMDVDDDLIGKANNYADTLASLLSLLSHPSEIAEAQEGVTSTSVVFVIDEFDLFATHARQTLLYNLFDIAQARKAPIAVLGLTNKIDVVEGLEKRVKSRFSHRYVYMSLPKTLAAYWSVCRQGLVVDDEDAKSEGLDTSVKGFAKFHDYWTKKTDALFEEQAFKDHIEYHYCSNKSVPAFLGSCVLPLAGLSPTNLTLRFSPTLTSDPPDSKLHLLGSLSDLDLALLISAARLDIVAHTDTVNFAMAYDEYTTLIGRQRVQSAAAGMLALGGGVRVWGRGVAEMAWERLVSLGLLLPTGMGGRHGGIEGRMWKVDVILEEIPAAVKLNAVLARWCREI